MRLLTVIMFCLISPGAIAQYIYVGATVGQYNMGEMKSIQESARTLLNSQGFPVEKTLVFPASLQLDLGLDWIKDKRSFGVFFNYARTVGKLDYSDYSGELYEQQEIIRYAVGVKKAWTLKKGFGVYGKGGFNYNEIYFTDYIGLSQQPSQKQVGTTETMGFIIEPGVQYFYPLGKVYFCLRAGFEINGKLPVKDGPETNWSGLRLSFAVGFDAKRNK